MFAPAEGFAGPEMTPVALRKVDLPFGFLRLPYRRDQHVRPQEIFKLFAVAARVVFMMQKERTLHDEDEYVWRGKLIRYAAGRGFEMDEILDNLD